VRRKEGRHIRPMSKPRAPRCGGSASDLTDEELRLAIGQQMSVRILVPVAIDRLEANPLASGDMYCGALLEHVLKAVTASEVAEDRLQILDAVVQRFNQGRSPARIQLA
jgi:hypothetical protein